MRMKRFLQSCRGLAGPREQIEEDFKKFVSDDCIPYYVNDFIRKNKKHIDEMRTSIFMFRGIE